MLRRITRLRRAAARLAGLAAIVSLAATDLSNTRSSKKPCWTFQTGHETETVTSSQRSNKSPINNSISTYGRDYAAVFRPPACLSSVTYVLLLNGASYSKSYYWQLIRSRIWGIDWRQNEWLWPLFRGLLKSCQPLRHIRRWISRKPLEIEALFQIITNRKWPTGGFEWSRDVIGHVTWNPNMLRAQHLENSC